MRLPIRVRFRSPGARVIDGAIVSGRPARRKRCSTLGLALASLEAVEPALGRDLTS
jgi:hypothetical protein